MAVRHYAVLYEDAWDEAKQSSCGPKATLAVDHSAIAKSELAGETIVFHPISFSKGQSVAQAVYLSGLFAPPPLCSGMGRCGYCRVGVWRRTDDGYSSVPLTAQEQEYFQRVSGQEVANSTDLPEGSDGYLPIGIQLLAQQFLRSGSSPEGKAHHGPTPEADGGSFCDCEQQSGSRENSPMGGYWRLGCQHVACAGDVVLLPENTVLLDEVPFALEDDLSCKGAARFSPPDAGLGQEKADWLAVDMGTTSVHWTVSTHNQRRGGSFSNPQMGAGSDVVSRIQASLLPRGRQRLADLSQTMVRSLARQAGGAKVVILAANPAMVGIFLGQDVTSLAHAPYALPDKGGDWANVAGVPPLWVCPHISPFVGGDISAGYAFLTQQQVDYPFLLADMGTNGEFILALSPEKAFATSVALGPALEGINLTFGSEAKEGVVVDFTVTPLSLAPVWFSLADKGEDKRVEGLKAEQENLEPRHAARMSGTAYISLLSQLIDGRAMTRQGQFVAGGGNFARFLRHYSGQAGSDAGQNVHQGGGQSVRPGPKQGLTQRAGQEVKPEDEIQSLGPFFPLPHNMKLYARDVEEIIKVKAAFSLGLKRLLAFAKMPFHEIRHVYLAGALGHNVNTMALENLGFFPPGAHERIVPVGNAALAGAEELARHEDLRTWLVAWTKTVTPVNLAEDSTFAHEFLSHMHFEW